MWGCGVVGWCELWGGVVNDHRLGIQHDFNQRYFIFTFKKNKLGLELLIRVCSGFKANKT